MASKSFIGAADLGTAEAVSLTEDAGHAVDVYNIQNTGSVDAEIYVMLQGAADHGRLDGVVPAGEVRVLDGLRRVQSFKVLGVGAVGVITA